MPIGIDDEDSLTWLSGKKTYLAAGVMLVLGLVHNHHLLSFDDEMTILTFAGALGLTGLRSAIAEKPSGPTTINTPIAVVTQEQKP